LTSRPGVTCPSSKSTSVDACSILRPLSTHVVRLTVKPRSYKSYALFMFGWLRLVPGFGVSGRISDAGVSDSIQSVQMSIVQMHNSS
jgi:hypothetical protein